MFTEFLAFFLRVCYIISVNCGMSLRSILKGVGCVRPSFNLAGKDTAILMGFHWCVKAGKTMLIKRLNVWLFEYDAVDVVAPFWH